MAMRKLRVYTEPDLKVRDFAAVEECGDQGVRVSLGEILPLLADADQHRCQQVVPGPNNAAALDGFVDDGPAGNAVQGLRGSC